MREDPCRIEFEKVKRYSLRHRKSKASLDIFCKSLQKGMSVAEFLESLPRTLAASELKEVAEAILRARRRDRPVVLAMGAHPIKVGLSPLIIDLMEKNIITAIATNGASVIHDFELAYAGKTSEDVDLTLQNGTFGMAEETAVLLNKAIAEGAASGKGIGESVGLMIHSSEEFPYKQYSLFEAAYRLGLPATVHVAIGTDIIHIHPEFDGAATGRASEIDFKKFCSVVCSLQEGVFINLGSAVLMPEVFLKAISVARNLGYSVDRLTTVTMDFQRQYRAAVNVVHRPTIKQGRGYYLIGHHEIMFPLLAATIMEYY